MRWVIISVIVLFIPIAASAELDPFEISLGGGMSLPANPTEFANYWHTGQYFNVELGQKVSRYWYLTFSVEYGRYAFDADSYPVPIILLSRVASAKPGPEGQGDTQYLNPVILNRDGDHARTVAVLFGARMYANAVDRTAAPFLAGQVGYFKHSGKTQITWNYSDIYNWTGIDGDGVLLALNLGLDFSLSKHLLPFVKFGFGYSFLNNGKTTQFFPLTAGLRFRL
ncbi:hypothetical protein TRIP_C21253 [Candidatus Zixiibacteriota bacterium]|nr:hypothetical protein TRIP_C21253 [candidate division Zixibacteria bacterium]